MAFDISQFRSQLQYDGARPTLFEVNIVNPITNVAYTKIPFMVSATRLPEYRLGVAEAYYFGRRLPTAGDRTFLPWSVRVINDEDFLIRDGFEQWSNEINALKSNIRQTSTDAFSLYQGTGTATQYGKTGIPLRTYQFSGIWPTDVGPIELGWERQNRIEMFQAEFEFNWFEVVQPSTTGLAGGNF
jgi:hypothetical protein